MATETASTVVQDLLANNIRVSKQVIGVYRAATGYLVNSLDTGMKRALASRPAGRVDADTRLNIGSMGARVTGLYAKTFERVSDGAEQIVDQIGGRTSGAIDKVASSVADVDNKYVTRYLQLANRVSLPALKLARDLTDSLATRTEHLKVSHPAKTRTAKKAKRIVRKTAKTARRARRA